jgi:Rod binding domain-containing protein
MLAALNNTALAPTSIPAVRLAAEANQPFAVNLASNLPAKPKQDPRQAARQLIGQALLAPLVKAMRQDPFKSKLFHGGQAEDAFTDQLDQQFVERMSERMNGPLVDSVYRQITRAAPSVGSFVRHG